MSQRSLDPKNEKKVCSVVRIQTDGHTDTKVEAEDSLSGFMNFPFNLSSRIGPKTARQAHKQTYR